MEKGFGNSDLGGNRPPATSGLARHSDGRRPDRYIWLTARLRGPGGLYNLGNVLALVMGVVVHIFAAGKQSNFGAALRDHFLGSPGSLWLTGSMVLFIVSGELYHRASQQTQPANPRMTQLGDTVSGIAAISLTVALVWMGGAVLALLAGVLLAGAKLGSAVLPTLYVRRQALMDRIFRSIAAISRGPSILALCPVILAALQVGGDLSVAILPSTMVVCFLLWLWADLLLLRAGPVALIDRRRMSPR